MYCQMKQPKAQAEEKGGVLVASLALRPSLPSMDEFNEIDITRHERIARLFLHSLPGLLKAYFVPQYDDTQPRDYRPDN